MLRIEVPIGAEGWDEKKRQFVEPKVQVLTLEHSLISLSKWESKWCKAFLSKREKTNEETLDYIKCMTLTPNVDPEVYDYLTMENIQQINKYIEHPMTATVFPKDSVGKPNRETVTSELIYYWMIALNIPIEECQKWHINRLLTLIRLCNLKNSPPKKRSSRNIVQDYAALNEARRKQFNTKG